MLTEGRHHKTLPELWALILVLGVESGDFKCKKKKQHFGEIMENLSLKSSYFDSLLYCYLIFFHYSPEKMKSKYSYDMI